MHSSAALRAIMVATAILLSAGDAAARAQIGEPERAAPHRVFFDWGKAIVSQDSAATLDDVAALLLQPGSGQASLVGHTDRSGPASANQRSALQRAAAVRDYLVARGVRPDQIDVASQGEDAPFIATADGVREPQNRRVDVIIAAPTVR